MAETQETQEQELTTPEEIAAYRSEVAAELEAEESGKPIEKPAEKVVEKPPEETAELEAEAEIKTETEEDPFAGAPAAKALYDELSAKVDVLTGNEVRLHQAEKRIGAITNAQDVAKKAAEEADTAPTAEQIKEATESKEKWNELGEDFPDWKMGISGHVEERIELLRKEMKELVGKGVDVEALKEELTAGITSQVELTMLTKYHPDWEKTKDSKDYLAWKAGVPKEDPIFAKLPTESYLEAITVLDAFNDSKGTTKTAAEIASQRRTKLKGSVLPESRKIVAPKSDDDRTDAEYRAKIIKDKSY